MFICVWFGLLLLREFFGECGLGMFVMVEFVFDVEVELCVVEFIVFWLEDGILVEVVVIVGW